MTTLYKKKKGSRPNPSMNFLRFLPELLVRYFPALMSGSLMTLAFPGTQWAWLAWGALIPLVLSIRGVAPGQAFNNRVDGSGLIAWN